MLARREGDDARAVDLYERALERYRGLRQIHGMGQTLSALAELSARGGAYQRARELYAEALELYRETGYTRRVATSLIGLAAIAAASGRPERGAHLCGGIDAFVESQGVVLEPQDRAAFDATIESLRKTLGDAFTDEWAEGRKMTTEETITHALQLSPTGAASPRMRRAGTRS